METLLAWLSSLGLERYADVFARNEVDFDTLKALTEKDLEDLGLPFGPRRKLINALNTQSAPSITSSLEQVAASSPRLPSTPSHLIEKILASKASLEGERKQVTVLFADLKGSMELLADRDPEEAREILDPVLERMMDAVHRYEGTVNQVMGDGIMALFGAPLAHEDHAVRASYAALRMQEVIGRYADELRRARGIDVQIRVGLNSGEVVVRAIGSDLRMDYSAVGHTTHLAARMEQLARPGSILLTPETLRLAEGYIQVRSLGAMPVKGVAHPVEVYELTGVSSARTRLQAALGRGLTRFVGRQAEMEVLASAIGEAGRGKGQAVAIVGEAGVGKSRLFHEFTRSHRTTGWLVVAAGSVSYGKATPYLPIIDLLKSYFKIGDRDEVREIQEKVNGKLLTLDRSLESILSPLFGLFGLPAPDPDWEELDPPRRRRQTLDALKHLWLREARVQPLVLVFEDLHWIDTETQEFLNGLMESFPAAKVLLLFNYRPEYKHPWGSKTYYRQIRLDPLARQNAQELLDSLIGGDPALAPLKQLLIGRTEGNPFYLEESVRTLVETGALSGDKGAHHLARPLESIEVPATVQAILASRIDRLAQDDKRLLQCAAVIGKDVPFAVLQAVAELGDAALQEGLARLQAAEFLYEASLFPDLEYTFKHALTHEVTYNGLLKDRRETLHLHILVALEELYAGRIDERVEGLAHHALRAGAWAKAVAYLRQSGVKAFDRSATREAAHAFEQALEAISHMPQSHEIMEQTVDLCLALRPCVTALGDMRRLLAAARRAEPLVRLLGDPRREALVTGYQAAALNNSGSPREGLAMALRGVAIAEAGRDSLATISAHFFVGQAQASLGEFRQAIATLDRDLGFRTIDLIELAAGPKVDGILDARSSLTSRVFARFESAVSHAEIGLFNEGALRASGVIEVSDNIPLVFFRAYAELGPGYLRAVSGRPALGLPFLERGLAISEESDLPNAFIHAANGLGLAKNMTGCFSEALGPLERAWRLAQSGQFLHWGLVSLTHLAESYDLLGRHDDALNAIDQALKISHDAGYRAREAWALYMQGCILGRARITESALKSLSSAFTIAGELEMRPLIAHCHLETGRICSVLGQKSRARDHLNLAIEMYSKMDMPYWLEKAEGLSKEIPES